MRKSIEHDAVQDLMSLTQMSSTTVPISGKVYIGNGEEKTGCQLVRRLPVKLFSSKLRLKNIAGWSTSVPSSNDVFKPKRE